MTTDQLRAMYQEVNTLGHITLDVSPEIGPTYLLSRLQECRRQQDRIQTLTVEVHQAASAARKAKRAHQAKLALLKGQADRAKDRYDEEQALHKAEDLLDDVTTLERVLSVTRNTLKTADSDIRLAARLLDTQVRLGQVRAPAVNEQPVSVPSAFAEGERAAGPTRQVEMVEVRDRKTGELRVENAFEQGVKDAVGLTDDFYTATRDL